MRFAAAFLAATTLFGADSVLDRGAAHAERFNTISRQIWESPELGFQEQKSSALLQQELRANGFRVLYHKASLPSQR